MEEVEQFGQKDLDQTDVMILDCFNEVFVWVGEQANEAERDHCFGIAEVFVRFWLIDKLMTSSGVRCICN